MKTLELKIKRDNATEKVHLRLTCGGQRRLKEMFEDETMSILMGAINEIDKTVAVLETALNYKDNDNTIIGVWGQRHRQYLKEHHRVRYYNLLTAGKLNSYLAEIEKQDEEMFEQMVKSLAEKENVTEDLKANLPMEWVRKVNNIRNRAIEIMNTEVIFV